MVTRTGIEPMSPPWKGGVLTAWPTGLIYKELNNCQSQIAVHLFKAISFLAQKKDFQEEIDLGFNELGLESESFFSQGFTTILPLIIHAQQFTELEEVIQKNNFFLTYFFSRKFTLFERSHKYLCKYLNINYTIHLSLRNSRKKTYHKSRKPFFHSNFFIE